MIVQQMATLPANIYGYDIGDKLKPEKRTYAVTQGGNSFVMKLVSNQIETTENMILHLKSLNESNSSFIVHWIATSELLQYGDDTCLIFELCTNSLEHYQLHNNLPTNFNKLKGITEVCLGLAHLHEQSIIHGNLKPSNILFCQTGREWKLKISDFLVCNTVKSGDSFVCDMKPPDTCYRAPETWAQEGVKIFYRSTADTWSLGCFSYEVYKGRSYVNDDMGTEEMPSNWNTVTPANVLRRRLEGRKMDLAKIDLREEWKDDKGTHYLPLNYGQGHELVRVIYEANSERLYALVEEFGLRSNDGQNWTIQEVLGLVITKLIRSMLRADPFVRPTCHELLLFLSTLKDLERLVTASHPEMRPTNGNGQSSALSIPHVTPSDLYPIGQDRFSKWERMAVRGQEGELKFESFHLSNGPIVEFSLVRRQRKDPTRGQVPDENAQDAVSTATHHNTPAPDLRVWANFSNQSNDPANHAKVLIKLTLLVKCIPDSQENGNANNRREICKEATKVLLMNSLEPKNVLIYFQPKSMKLLANDDETNLPRLIVSAKVIP